MKVLAVSQYYWPEPFNVSEICEELVSRGHDVTVVTGLPNYPEGFIYDGFKDGAKRKEAHNGVTIHRSWIWPRKTGAVNRLLNYESFGRFASKLTSKLENDYDVVVAFEISPIMSALPAIAYARRTGCPLLLYVIDIWPECLLAGGISRDSAIYRHYSQVSKRIYAAADRLAITSPLFRDYIEKLLNRKIDVFDLPQFAEDLFEQRDTITPDGYRKDRVNLTFAGNVGAAQSVHTIIRAASKLVDSPILFHIVGSGSELDSCVQLAEDLGLANVVFHGRHPLEEMPSYYNASDAMVCTFADSPILAYTLPRKVQSYMAAGKPVLGTLVGESRRVIEEAQCGLCCEAEDYDGLANICRQFLATGEKEKNAMGDNAQRYNREHFSRERFFRTLESELIALKERRSE